MVRAKGRAILQGAVNWQQGGSVASLFQSKSQASPSTLRALCSLPLTQRFDCREWQQGAERLKMLRTSAPPHKEFEARSDASSQRSQG